MKLSAVVLLAFALCTGMAFAHNGMQHIMGVVTSLTDTSITVKATDGKIQSVALSSATKYALADTTATLKDIRVGDRIVIHATNKGDRLTAAEVRIAARKGSTPNSARR